MPAGAATRVRSPRFAHRLAASVTPRVTPTSSPTRAHRIAAALAPAALPLLLLAPVLQHGTVLYGYDTLGELYPWWTWAWRQIAEGEFPHWNPNVLCGLPFHGLAVVSLAYPLSLLNLVLDPPRTITLWCLAHLVLAGCFTQRHARALGCSPAAAALAGATFAGSEALLTRITAGELPQLAVVAWIPAAFWIVEDAVRRREPVRLVLTAAPVALMLLAGHLQYVAYGWMLVGAYAVARILGDPAMRTSPASWLALVGGWLLGTALAAHQVLPTLDAIRQSHRHLGLAPADGGGILLAPAGLARLLSPDLLGNEYTSTYVGPSVATQIPLYVGLVPLLLAASAVARRAPRSRLLALLVIGAIVYGLGDRTPLAPLVRALIPPLGGFRIPSRMLVLGALPLSLLAGLGFDVVTDPTRHRDRSRVAAWAGRATIAAALVTLAAIGSGLPVARTAWHHLTDLPPSPSATARRDAAWETARASAIRSELFLGLALLSTAVLRRHGATSRWPGGLVLAAAMLDLGLHASPWIRELPSTEASMAGDASALVAAMRASHPTPVGARVLSEVPVAREPRPPSFVDGYGIGGSPGEVLPNWLAAHGLRSVTGEIGLIPARTMLFTGNVGRYSIARVAPPARLDALAVAWLVAEERGAAPPGTRSAIAASSRDTALPIAFIADRIRPVADAREALRLLDDAPAGLIDPRLEALVEGVSPQEDGTERLASGVRADRAALRVLGTQRLAVTVDASRPAWLVVLEPFAPHWEAEVDGVPTTIHPAHVMFRAVHVPAGHHVVRMRYVPTPFWRGVAISAIAGLALLLALAAGPKRLAPATLPSASGRR
ncbi:MAG: YfhO family protein [Deltaproteobacteria bacterium]|nr:YfhO family protein [Deltaproteobacteria bacterium]